MKTQVFCPHRQQNCGGCPLLVIPYEEQLRRKQKSITSLLGRYCRPEPIVRMDNPFHYRNKAISTFSAAGKSLVSGIYEAHTHHVISVKECLLQDSRINEVIACVLGAASECRLPAFQEDRGTGLLRHMVVRRGVSTGEVSVTIVTSSELFPSADRFVSLILRACPDVVTVVQNINPRHTSAVLGIKEKVLYGEGFLHDKLCGSTFCISTRAFYQVNPSQTERLYQTALEFAALRKTETAIDVYCGIGTITLAAAKQADAVFGIEINGNAVSDAKRNAALNNCSNADFVRGDAAVLMKRIAGEGERADVVFLDPPREGASHDFLNALAILSPNRIVYISCEPSTLARDVSFLVEKGYSVCRVRPVDMFPHTEHVETVVLMSRIKE